MNTFVVIAMSVTSLLGQSLALAQMPGGGTTETALALCQQSDQFSGTEKQDVLTRGLELAQAAVEANPSDARAHFAVFCNLGKKIQSRTLGLGDLREIDRLRAEIDTALALAPNDTEAMVAKGAMLLELPWFLGGDRRRGEELLCTALNHEPANPAARRYLVEAVRARGGDEVTEPWQVCSTADPHHG